MTDQAVPQVDRAALASLLERRGRVRGRPVALSMFRDEIPEPYQGRMVEPCAIVREAMDFGRHAYVDAEHHACLAGAWQAGFIDPPEEISSGSYLATNTDFFTPEGAFRVKNGENVLPRGTVRAIGAAPLDLVPDDVRVDTLVVVCEPSVASMLGGVRVAIDGTPPRGAAGTSLCGDLFALPFHDPNVVISTGDVGGRMFNRIKPAEMFVIIPMQWAHMIPLLLNERPDIGGLMEAIKPGYLAQREARRSAGEHDTDLLAWDDDVVELMARAPDAIRQFAGPALEEYAREEGHERITMEVVAAQMASVGMDLSDIVAMIDEPGSPVAAVGSDAADDHGDLPVGPVRAAARLDIGASRELVWSTLCDVSGWSAWYPDIRDVSAGGPLHVGATFSFKTGPVTINAIVDGFDEQHLLRFAGRSRGAVATYRFRLESSGPGTTVSLAQVTSGVAARTMRPMLQKIADSSLPAWLHALRSHVEGW